MAPTTTTASNATGTRNSVALVSLNMVGASTSGSTMNAHPQRNRPRTRNANSIDATQIKKIDRNPESPSVPIVQSPDREPRCKRSQALMQRDRHLCGSKAEHEQRLRSDLCRRKQHDGGEEEQRNGAQSRLRSPAKIGPESTAFVSRPQTTVTASAPNTNQ